MAGTQWDVWDESKKNFFVQRSVTVRVTAATTALPRNKHEQIKTIIPVVRLTQ